MSQDLLTSVFTRLKGRLKSTASRLLTADDADDALQDAFVRLWSRRESLVDESQVIGVATTTVRNICIDRLRRDSAHPMANLDSAETASIPASANDNDDTAELYACVTALIDSEISERDREILYLRDRDGWDYDEIARRTGMTEANVRVIISRTRKTIRQLYTTRH